MYLVTYTYTCNFFSNNAYPQYASTQFDSHFKSFQSRHHHHHFAKEEMEIQRRQDAQEVQSVESEQPLLSIP